MSNLQRLVESLAKLRPSAAVAQPVEQTLSWIRRDLIRKAHDLLGPHDRDSDGLSEDLGDVLCIVLLLCQNGADGMQLDLETVAGRACDKLRKDNPCALGEPDEEAPAERDMASRELDSAGHSASTKRPSQLDGIPSGLPALRECARVGERASAVGFDWASVDGVLDKVREELAELETALRTGEGIVEEYGDLLQSCAHVGRHIGVEPEVALHTANRRFSERFRAMEALAAAEGIELASASPGTLDGLWERIKASA